MPSFDVVSETDMAEVDNAIANLTREISQRYDFKGSDSSITLKDDELIILADDELKLKQLHEILQVHFVKRKLDPNVLDYQKEESAAGQSKRQKVLIKQGIEKELAKKIVKDIKQSKLKVQVSIQGESLRVTGKKRDDLQAAIAHLKAMKIDLPLSYNNFRD